MNWLTKRLVLALAILATGCLAAGCAQGSNVKSAVASLSPSASLSFSPPTFSPKTSSPRPATAPATVQPTATAPAVAPASPAATPTATAQSPAASEPGSSLLWLWIVLGGLVIVTVTVLIARHFGRRSAMAASWRTRVADACAKGSALYDAMSMAEAPGALAAADAGARWADIQRRADDLTQALYELRETAPGETERARVADVLSTLHAVRSAMDAERSPRGAGAPQGARVHDLLMSFEASLTALRSP